MRFRTENFMLLCVAMLLIFITKCSSEKTEEVKECDCGEHANSCAMKAGQKICDCKKGYGQDDNGQCIVCDCGEHANSCTMKGGEKKCLCKTGYGQDDKGKCTEILKNSTSSTSTVTEISEETTSTTVIITKVSEKSTPSTSTVTAQDYCTENPCENGGNCTNTGDSYFCNCTEEFTGQNCSESALCDKNGTEICGNVPCKYDQDTQTVYCDCADSSLFFKVKSKTCQPIDECVLKLFEGNCSKLHETCREGECVCEENYIYSKDKETCEPNFCNETGRLICSEGEKCLELGSGNTLCVCDDGYYPTYNKCKRLDPCSPGLTECEQLCEVEGECKCFEGFVLKNDNKTCEKDPNTKTCEEDCHPGKCLIVNETKTCVCPSTTHISHGGKCVDKCTANNFVAPQGMCPNVLCEIDEEKGFRCKCDNFYKLAEDKIHCQRKEMCKEGGGEETCSKKSALCKENPNVEEGYECMCADGYEKDDDGICKKKCDLNKHQKKCAEILAECTLDADYTPVCECPQLLTKGKNGRCTKIAENSFMGEFGVQSRRYKVKSDEQRRKRSSDIIDYPLLREDFRQSFKIIYDSYKDSKIVSCDAFGEELKCSVELQLEKMPEKHRLDAIVAPSLCVPLENSNYCWVQPHLIMEKREKIFHDTDPCETDVKKKHCDSTTFCRKVDNSKNFECKCVNGFRSVGQYHPVEDLETFVQKCHDIDECTNKSLCPNNTECLNTYGGYKCHCKEGYKRVNDSDPKITGCIALCEPNPCIHGKCKMVGDHGFACECEKPYGGPLCNTTDVMIDDVAFARRNTSLVGGILGTLSVLLVIAIICMVIKIRKSKEMEEYATHRKRGILSELGVIGRRMQPERDDVEGRGNGFSAERLSIPRPKVKSRNEGKTEDRNNADPESFQKDMRRISEVQYKNRGYEDE